MFLKTPSFENSVVPANMQLLWGGHDWWEKVEAESQWPHGSENDCSLAKERKEVDKEGRKDWLKCDHILCPWKLLSNVKQETEGQEAKHNYLIRKSRWENFRSHQDVQKKKKKKKQKNYFQMLNAEGSQVFLFLWECKHELMKKWRMGWIGLLLVFVLPLINLLPMAVPWRSSG